MKVRTRKDLPILHSQWLERLEKVFQGILAFAPEANSREGIAAFRGKSPDFRTLLSVHHSGRELIYASLQLALPDPADIEMLKLSCWTLLFLASMFPEWKDAGGWVTEATEWASETGEIIPRELQHYCVTCQYDRVANLMDFQVRKLAEF